MTTPDPALNTVPTDLPDEETSGWRSRPPVSVLSPDQLRHFEDVLLLERRVLLEKARRSWAEDMRFDENELADEIDQASAEYVQALSLRLRDREGYYLRKIEVALKRIWNGSFGICTECGEPIPLPRLKARPVALFCAGCKEQLEKIERAYSG